MKQPICIITLLLFVCGLCRATEPTDSCTHKLVQLITSSRNFSNPFKEKLSAEISQEGDTPCYNIELFVSDEGENSRNTVGWVKLDTSNNTLTDITNDPDDGKRLEYNEALYNDYIGKCLGIKNTLMTMQNQQPSYCNLPFSFDDYYEAMFSDPTSAAKYPKHSFTNECAIYQLLRGKYQPSEYMYLPPVNQYQVIILCNTDTDIETYDLIVADKDRVLSSLQVGKMNGHH